MSAKYIVPLALCGILGLLIVQMRLKVLDPQDQARKSAVVDRSVIVSPGSDILQIAALEHRHLWADLFWLELVQELGTKKQTGEAVWNQIYQWTEIATDFDPLYETIYRSVSVHLSVYGKKFDDSDKIAEKGWKHLPHSWHLPLMIGYNAYFEKGDATRGSEYIYHAARIPGSPRYLPALAGRMQFHSGDESGAVSLLEMMIDSLEGPAKEAAIYRLKAMKSEPRLRLFDDACERFVTDTGTTAKTGEQLVEAGYLDILPFDLFGSAITFNKINECVAVTEEIPLRESQAKERFNKKKKESPSP